MKKCIIVSFEGIDGCGKTTQSKKFFNYLKNKGIDAVLLREPGGTEAGEKIREILLDKNINISKWTELFLYLASRAQLISEVIKKYEEKKIVIIFDRYYDSTIAYQGYGRGLPISMINNIQKKIIKNFKPDITFLIDEDVEKLFKNLKEKDRIERESIEFQKRVREGYLNLAKKEKRIKVIKRSSIEETFKNICRQWERFLNEKGRYKEFLKKCL